MYKETIALLLSQSSFRILMFFNKIWQKFSTGIDFHQENPDWENQLSLCNHTNFDKILEER